jgi:hypothetical protein
VHHGVARNHVVRLWAAQVSLGPALRGLRCGRPRARGPRAGAPPRCGGRWAPLATWRWATWRCWAGSRRPRPCGSTRTRPEQPPSTPAAAAMRPARAPAWRPRWATRCSSAAPHSHRSRCGGPWLRGATPRWAAWRGPSWRSRRLGSRDACAATCCGPRPPSTRPCGAAPAATVSLRKGRGGLQMGLPCARRCLLMWPLASCHSVRSLRSAPPARCVLARQRVARGLPDRHLCGRQGRGTAARALSEGACVLRRAGQARDAGLERCVLRARSRLTTCSNASDGLMIVLCCGAVAEVLRYSRCSVEQQNTRPTALDARSSSSNTCSV